MLRTFLSFSGITFTSLASFFLIRGTLATTVKDLAEMSITKLGYNSNVITNLTRQRTDTKIGFCVLLLALVIQVVNTTWPLRIDDFEVSWEGIVLAIAVTLILYLWVNRLSNSLPKRDYETTMLLIKQRLHSK